MEMRALRVVVFATSCFLASDGWTNDVCYKLNADAFNTAETRVSLAPPAIVISDRVWAAPGVEQTTEDLLPPLKFDVTGKPRLRVEASEDCRDIGTIMRYPHVGPEWLDEVAWPLTRKLYGLGRPYYDGGDERTEYTFGLITLQR
jgi:hypothetical protein